MGGEFYKRAVDEETGEEVLVAFSADGKPTGVVEDKMEWDAPKAQPSAGESLLRGAGQGASLYLSDEAAGVGGALASTPFAALINPMFGLPVPPQEDFGTTYARGRDAERAKNRAAQEANPGQYMGGELLGGLLPGMLMPATRIKGTAEALDKSAKIARMGLPSRMLAAGGRGAAGGLTEGAVASFGAAEGTAGEQMAQTGRGTLTGGVVGGAMGAAAEVAVTPMRWMGNAIWKRLKSENKGGHLRRSIEHGGFEPAAIGFDYGIRPSAKVAKVLKDAVEETKDKFIAGQAGGVKGVLSKPEDIVRQKTAQKVIDKLATARKNVFERIAKNKRDYFASINGRYRVASDEVVNDIEHLAQEGYVAADGLPLPLGGRIRKDLKGLSEQFYEDVDVLEDGIGTAADNALTRIAQRAGPEPPQSAKKSLPKVDLSGEDFSELQSGFAEHVGKDTLHEMRNLRPGEVPPGEGHKKNLMYGVVRKIEADMLERAEKLGIRTPQEGLLSGDDYRKWEAFREESYRKALRGYEDEVPVGTMPGSGGGKRRKAKKAAASQEEIADTLVDESDLAKTGVYSPKVAAEAAEETAEVVRRPRKFNAEEIDRIIELIDEGEGSVAAYAMGSPNDRQANGLLSAYRAVRGKLTKFRDDNWPGLANIKEEAASVLAPMKDAFEVLGIPRDAKIELSGDPLSPHWNAIFNSIGRAGDDHRVNMAFERLLRDPEAAEALTQAVAVRDYFRLVGRGEDARVIAHPGGVSVYSPSWWDNTKTRAAGLKNLGTGLQGLAGASAASVPGLRPEMSGLASEER